MRSVPALPKASSGRIQIVLEAEGAELRQVANVLTSLEDLWIVTAEDRSARLTLERAGQGSLILWLVIWYGAKSLSISAPVIVKYVAALGVAASTFNALIKAGENAQTLWGAIRRFVWRRRPKTEKEARDQLVEMMRALPTNSFLQVNVMIPDGKSDLIEFGKPSARPAVRIPDPQVAKPISRRAKEGASNEAGMTATANPGALSAKVKSKPARRR
jgi:hypothetical protein